MGDVFLADYVSLLATLQNQGYFSDDQVELFVQWLAEVVGSQKANEQRDLEIEELKTAIARYKYQAELDQRPAGFTGPRPGQGSHRRAKIGDIRVADMGAGCSHLRAEPVMDQQEVRSEGDRRLDKI